MQDEALLEEVMTDQILTAVKALVIMILGFKN
jgi:hypothetical protein